MYLRVISQLIKKDDDEENTQGVCRNTKELWELDNGFIKKRPPEVTGYVEEISMDSDTIEFEQWHNVSGRRSKK